MKLRFQRWVKGAMLSALALTAFVCASENALAQTGPQIPHLWDAKERLPKPDLSRLERLRFLTTTDFPPFSFLDSQGRLTGFHVDLVRAICAELGVMDRCQIQALPWSELGDALERGEGEALIAGLAATAEQREKYEFSRPYIVFPARFATLASKPMDEPLYPKLQGKRIGVIAGSAHEKMLRAGFGQVQVVTYARQNWISDDLKAGKLDAMFGDGMRLGFWLASPEAANCCRFAGGPYLSPQYLGGGLTIALPKSRPELTAAMNHALQAVSNKPIFGELYLRYFPVGFF